MLLHSPTEDGKGISVLRAREDTVEAGVLRPLEEGKPVAGEVVKLTRRPECPILFDAETEVRVGAQETAPADSASRRSGPAQVATETYRKGWDAVWRRPDPTLN